MKRRKEGHHIRKITVLRKNTEDSKKVHGQKGISAARAYCGGCDKPMWRTFQTLGIAPLNRVLGVFVLNGYAIEPLLTLLRMGVGPAVHSSVRAVLHRHFLSEKLPFA